MKRLPLFLPAAVLALILLACNGNSDCTNGIQDGNETGVDCGGNCPSCSSSSSNNNNTNNSNLPPAALTNGVWYENYIVNTGGSGIAGSELVYINNNPRTVDFLTTLSPIYPGYYNLNASPYCSTLSGTMFLAADMYNYNNGKINDVLGSADIIQLTNDSLVLKKSPYHYDYLSRNHSSGFPLTMGNSYTVQWEFNLSAPYTGTDMPEVFISYRQGGAFAGTKIDSVLLTPGQTAYSGTATFPVLNNIDCNNVQNALYISMYFQTNNYSGSPGLVHLANARLTLNGISAKAGPGTYCSSYSSDCSPNAPDISIMCGDDCINHILRIIVN